MTISTQISRVICDGTLPSRLWSSEFRHQLTAILHRHLVEVKKRLEVQTLFISKCKLNIMIFSAAHADQYPNAPSTTRSSAGSRPSGSNDCPLARHHPLSSTRCNLDHPVAISRFSPVSHTSTTMVRSLCTKFWSDRKGSSVMR